MPTPVHAPDLTLVIDIGKSHARLLLFDARGTVLEQHARANASVDSAMGYPALDVHGLERWMQASLRGSENARRCGHVIACTHGAALVALDGAGADAGLAWEPLDYEYAALDGAAAQDFAAGNDFGETLSPELPAGLNAARQLWWMENTHPAAWRRTRCLVPYAQYWAWRLSGVACSEVSSLGCHTHLWNPHTGDFSRLARARGWAQRFAPLRSAWEVLGPVRADVAAPWGLPAAARVHVGVHDSNACLARYLPGALDGAAQAEQTLLPALTLVSSGTWTVLMAPGAPASALVAGQDMLANVDVTGRLTPTARFMGGREFAHLLDGACADAAGPQDLRALVAERLHAYPAFAAQGGPFAGRAGCVLWQDRPLPAPLADALSARQRAALAALYCAQMSCWLIHALWGARSAAQHTVIVEGPLAHNRNYLLALQALLPGARCHASVDAVEGTARGAWCLVQRAHARHAARLEPVAPVPLPGIADYHRHWLRQLQECTSSKV
ncbi:L-fuculose kinase [Verminephrobacter aporrectodeae subsp. tuberculatae]|uniref:FGGY family carbohydrate kinase n=4 Tax=Verminephrobacter aporrectodeae TaxID=1110389 RepID=UPI002243B52C|nr:FGGY family carbohydrate kinase [Verminephrobacter aporrectodeae]MCW8165089.1 L-fuculose kinase [Verminephrobacter aporrectodeae subsp. tuberculatae]MCW8170859.1 L-fuculose kinase [Verminephrobacter aporrectodeae subsp. tuberculatae]